MTEHDNLILRIRRAEEEAAQMLSEVESENSQRIDAANTAGLAMIQSTETLAKENGQKRFLQAKEQGKEIYKNMLVDSDNKRRDDIENGKLQVAKAKKFVHDHFLAMFEV